MADLSHLLRTHRGDRRQADVAEAAGVDLARVVYYENSSGRAPTRPWEIRAIAAATDTPAFELLRSVGWWPQAVEPSQRAALAADLYTELLRLYGEKPSLPKVSGNGTALALPIEAWREITQQLRSHVDAVA